MKQYTLDSFSGHGVYSLLEAVVLDFAPRGIVAGGGSAIPCGVDHPLP